MTGEVRGCPQCWKKKKNEKKTKEQNELLNALGWL